MSRAKGSPPKCGAKAKTTGRPCKNPAGFKTDHPGEGRCHLHGGATPIKRDGSRSKLLSRRIGDPKIFAEYLLGPAEDLASLDLEAAVVKSILAKLIAGDYKRKIRKDGKLVEVDIEPLLLVEEIRRLISTSGLLAYRRAKVRGDLVEKFEDLTKRPVSPAEAFAQFFGPELIDSAIERAKKALGEKAAGPVIDALREAARRRKASG